MKKVFIAVLIFFVLSGHALAKTDKVQARADLTRQRAIAHMKRDMDLEYNQLFRLYQKKSYPEFHDKVMELQIRLTQSSLPLKDQKTIALKIDRLATKAEKAYKKEKANNEKKSVAEAKVKKEKPVVSQPKKEPVKHQVKEMKKKPKVVDHSNLSEERQLEAFKEDRDEDSRRIRKEILTAYPHYREDKNVLADAVVERKIKIAREREFLQSEFADGVEGLYQKAVNLYEKESLARSQKDFQEVEQLSPDYKSTRSYLKKLADQTRKAALAKPKRKTQR